MDPTQTRNFVRAHQPSYLEEFEQYAEGWDADYGATLHLEGSDQAKLLARLFPQNVGPGLYERMTRELTQKLIQVRAEVNHLGPQCPQRLHPDLRNLASWCDHGAESITRVSTQSTRGAVEDALKALGEGVPLAARQRKTRRTRRKKQRLAGEAAAASAMAESPASQEDPSAEAGEGSGATEESAPQDSQTDHQSESGDHSRTPSEGSKVGDEDPEELSEREEDPEATLAIELDFDPAQHETDPANLCIVENKEVESLDEQDVPRSNRRQRYHDTTDMHTQEQEAVRIYGAGWHNRFGLPQPLLRYWKQFAILLRWYTRPMGHSRGGTNTDFWFATGTQVCLPSEQWDSITVSRATRFFASSTRQLAKLGGAKLDKEVKGVDTRTLAGLGLPLTTGLQGRVRLLKAETVNKTIHDMAIRMALGMVERTWMIPLQPPDERELVWKADSPRAMGGGSLPGRGCRGGNNPSSRAFFAGGTLVSGRKASGGDVYRSSGAGKGAATLAS